MGILKKWNLARWLFVLPAMLIVGLLLIYPICSSVYFSFTTKHLIKPAYQLIGFENYKAVLTDPGFYAAFFNSLKWTIFSLAGQILIGFTAALALNKIKYGKGIYRTLLIIPWAFPSIVIALSWKWILNGVYGFLPNLLVQLGICNQAPPIFVLGNVGICHAGICKCLVWGAYDYGKCIIRPSDNTKGSI